jgi:hypothetical protein
MGKAKPKLNNNGSNGSTNGNGRQPTSHQDTHLYCSGRRRPIDPEKATAQDKKLLAQRSAVSIYNPDSHKKNDKPFRYGAFADNAAPHAYKKNGQWHYW